MHTRFIYIAALVLFSLHATSFQTQAQDLTAIGPAVWPLSIDLREAASVLQATNQGTFDTLRAGHNGFFCIADQPKDDRFSVECHPETLRAYLARRRYLSHTESRQVRDSLLAQEFQSEQWSLPVGALSRFISGRLNQQTGVPDSVWVWSEIAVPFAGSADTGLPTENMGAAPWLMGADKQGAHIMVGYAFISWSDLLKTVDRSDEMK